MLFTNSSVGDNVLGALADQLSVACQHVRFGCPASGGLQVEELVRLASFAGRRYADEILATFRARIFGYGHGKLQTFTGTASIRR